MVGEGWRSMAGLLGTSIGENGPETGEQWVTFGTVSLLLKRASK